MTSAARVKLPPRPSHQRHSSGAGARARSDARAHTLADVASSQRRPRQPESGSCASRSCGGRNASSPGARPAASPTRSSAASSCAQGDPAGRAADARGDQAPRRVRAALGRGAGLRAHRGRRGRDRRRDELPAQPRGDLLQAGPLLVRDGAPCFERALDPEGFSAGQSQFDSDITDGRHPRARSGSRRPAWSRWCVTGAPRRTRG